jgi:hypothetical protein
LLGKNVLRLAATIFLSAFLLFQVQPMMGRYVLPWFGGTPAVWSTCLLFFQFALLAGYLYAHWLGSLRNTKVQAAIHVTLLAASLAFLPITPHQPMSDANPTLRILLLLGATVGAPYFLLSATAPLLQRWFTFSQPERAPWRLYALSNFGSFLALLSYPFAVEPFVRLRVQTWIWSGVYVVFVALCVAQAISSPALAPREETGDKIAGPTGLTILFWLGLSATGSTLLLATTNLITQDIAVSPFLWIAPLSIYLLSFVLAFESDRWYPRLAFAIATGILVPAACAVTNAGIGVPILAQLGVYLAALFATCMVCQGELRRSRPEPRYLTTFYLTIAAGGALGGGFVALIAPHIYTEFSEYPVGLAAACLLGLTGWLRTGAFQQWTSRNFAVRIPLMALLLGGITAVIAAAAGETHQGLAVRRNFYGILRITETSDSNGALRQLTHGRIKHGSQYLDSALRDRPTSYYGPHSGVGLALNALPDGPRRIAVVGLGTGTLAAWGRPGDSMRFYEINPIVPEIATTWFSYLPNSKARTEVVLGDARVQLAREERSHDFDLIAVDAFSSDAIPVHLLTAECADLYRQRLAPGGLLLLHISNRTLDLEPVTRGLARYLNWSAGQVISENNAQTGEDGATWVLLTENLRLLREATRTAATVGWVHPDRPPILWTDDFSSLWHVLKY